MKLIRLMKIALVIVCIIFLIPVLGFCQSDITTPVVLQPKVSINPFSASNHEVVKTPAKPAAPIDTIKKSPDSILDSNKKAPANVVKNAIAQTNVQKNITPVKKRSRPASRHRRVISVKKKPVIQNTAVVKPVAKVAAKPAISLAPVKAKPISTIKSIKPPVYTKHRPDKIAALLVDDKTSSKSDSTLNGKALFSTLMALLLVLGLAYVTILLIKWASGQRGMTQSGTGKMKVLESARLSQTGTIHIVSVKGKKLLIGSASGQVTLLQELEPDEEDETVTEEKGNFQGYLEKYSKAGNSETPAARVASFLRDSSQQLKEKYRTHNSSKTGGGKKS